MVTRDKILLRSIRLFLFGLLLAGAQTGALAAPSPRATIGLLDQSFSDDGVMSKSVFTQQRNIAEQANAIITDAEGRLLVIGRNNRELFGYWGSAFVARFTSQGVLDETFADKGTLQLPYGYLLQDAKIDSEGRIVISGFEFIENDDCWDSQTLLMRLTDNGQFDTSFAATGIIKTQRNECDFYLPETSSGHSVVIDGDNKIITNTVVSTDSGFESYLVRYNADGGLDTTFGINGLVNTGLTHGLWDDLNIRLVLSGDKILMAGNEDGEFGGQGKLKLHQYQVNGTLDETFGNGGRVEVSTEDYDANLDEILLTSEGNIVLLEHEGFAHELVYLYSFSSAGQLNTGFGDNGRVKVDVPDSLGANLAILEARAALTTDDAMVMAFFGDYFGSAITKMAVTRLDKTGALDTTFGTSGTTLIEKEAHTSGARRLEVDSAGNIHVAGYLTEDDTNNTDLLIAKVKSDGSLDTAFADQGLSITNISRDELSASDDSVHASLFLPNDRLMQVGITTRTVDNADEGYLLVTIMDSTGQLQTDFDDDGIALIALGHIPNSVKAFLDSENRVVVVAGGEKSISVARLLSNGALDTSFAQQGLLKSDFDHAVQVGTAALVSLAQGYKVAVAVEQYRSPGTTSNNNVLAQLIAVSDSGTLESDFGLNGKVTLASYQTYGMFASSNGTISVTGSDYDLIITEHFTSSGQTDTSYIGSGIATVSPDTHQSMPDNVDWFMRAAELDINGNILVVLNTQNSGGSGNNLLLRLNRAGVMDGRFLSMFGETDGDLVSESVTGLTVDINGQIVVSQTMGVHQTGFDGFYGSTLKRLHQNGDIDTAFGSEGEIDALDSRILDTAIDGSGQLYIVGSRPDGEEAAATGSLIDTVNFSVSRLTYGVPELNAQQTLAMWLNEGQVKRLLSSDLNLSEQDTQLILASAVNAGALFNDVNGNNQLDGSIELLSLGESISRSDIDSGRLKFEPNGTQSAHFKFRTATGAPEQLVLLQVNPRPEPQLYAPSQSPLTDVKPVVAVDFGELVTGFDANDVEVTNGTLESISFDGYQYLLTIAAQESLADGGTITVNIAEDAAQDLSGADSKAASVQFEWTSLLPVEIGAPSLATTGVTPVRFDVTFVDVVNFELTKDEIELHSEGGITGIVSVANGSSLTPTVTVSGISGNGSFHIIIQQGAGLGSDGRKTQARQSQTVQVVNTAPSIAIKLDGSDKTVHGPATYNVDFTNAASVNLTADMVKVISDDGVTASVSVSGGSTNSPQVVLSEFRGSGFVGIELAAGAATSEGGIASSVESAPYSLKILPNTAPSISGSPATTAKQSEAYAFTPVANDVDGNDGLVFAVTNKPGWANFDEQTGMLSGTPTASDIATFADIVISVSDPRGDGASLAAFNIEVVANDGGTDGGDGGDGTGGGDGGNDGGTDDSVVGEVLVPIIIMLLEEDKKKRGSEKIDK